jgi:hypothetical protein
MSQPIKSNQFNHGAGKGSEERPVDRAKFRNNFDSIRWTKQVSGTVKKQKAGKVSITYRSV